jgi:putative tricarboxylic transport membrane protein
VICALGTFTVHASFVEVWLMLAASIVGFFMRMYGFSPAALVLALVLGPLAEQALRQTMTISRGSFDIFFERTASLSIIALTIALLVLLPLMGRYGARAKTSSKAKG